MSRRYLFGPVTATSGEALRPARGRGECLTFGPEEGADLRLSGAETWDEALARLPDGWRPEFVVLDLGTPPVPAGLWSAPVPLVGLARDARRCWHQHAHALGLCDLVLAPATTADLLTRAGLTHVRTAVLGGCRPDLLAAPAPEGGRDIDVLFAGPADPAADRELLPWLARLARLGERWRVVVHPGPRDEVYRALLARARVVVNLDPWGEANPLTFDAPAAGALLFQEAANREAAELFRPGHEYVPCSADDLEALLELHLSREDRRREMAAAGRERARSLSQDALWRAALGVAEHDGDALAERARQRQPRTPEELLPLRVWQAACGRPGLDPELPRDLARGAAAHPRIAAVHNALGLAAALYPPGRAEPPAAVAARAAACFRRAVECDPRHALARLNLTEALAIAGQTESAADCARESLALLDRTPLQALTGLAEVPFPPGPGLFAAEWERAAWSQAGNPAGAARLKRDLLRWRLSFLLGELADDPLCRFEAVAVRPDLPLSRAVLGCALARAGRPQQALEHLRLAVAADPFDLSAARALGHALEDTGDAEGQRRFARDRRLLQRAAPALVPAEPWFVESAPVGDELASLIVVCCNEVGCTRRCLESVLKHSRPPFELVVVDNGSTDATPAYLEELRRRAGPVRVEVVRNADNRGYPAAANQGLREARGRYLVLLNNDTVVTPGWLEGLVRWSLADWPQVGLVGPVTDHAPAPQQVPVGPAGLAELDEFARRRSEEQAGRALAVERLSGFCLLVRREVLDRVGLLDEQFGPGFFEDDDLGLRARQAGFKLLAALDVFVHHQGGRTFRALGLDVRDQLDKNFALFQKKWGTERTAAYRPPPDPVEAVVPAALPSAGKGVWLSMIVKNEEANLGYCLASVLDLVDGAVVCDTGSTDRTREIAASFGPKVKVIDFPWIDSFAAARNASLEACEGGWVFWMDADDRLDEDNRQKLRRLFASLGEENAAYTMKCLCLPDTGGGPATVVDHVRLFRRHPALRWKYRVHEQILPALRRLGSEVRQADVVIHHTGYQDPALRQRKLERDLRLLQREQAEDPDEPFVLFNLGSVHHERGEHAQALACLRRSLERSHPSDSIVRKLYALVMGCHLSLHQPGEALAACRAGRRLYPDDPELLYREGALRTEGGDLDGAAACYQRLLDLPDGAYFASVDPDLRGVRARHRLAGVLARAGREWEAEAHWREVVRREPGHLPAWEALAALYQSRGDGGRLAEARQHVEALQGKV